MVKYTQSSSSVSKKGKTQKSTTKSAAVSKAKPKKVATTKKSVTTKKSTKKVKDPNAPKRNKNGYMFFSNAMRESVKSENPDMKVTELAKELGEKWRGLSDEEKKPYLKLAEADKQRYDAEMKDYVAPEQ